MDTENNCSLNNSDLIMKRRDIFFRNDKTTSDFKNVVDRKSEITKILFGIMNKLFSARVVLNRLPNAEIEKLKGVKKPIKRLKNTKNPEPSESRCINEGISYVRICPKCRKPPAVRKTKRCFSCRTKLIYQCRKCLKEFTKYPILQRHIDGKCFIKGFYHCSMCDYKIENFVKLRLHVVRRHPSVEFNRDDVKWTDAKKCQFHECSQCGKLFDTHSLLNMHIPTCGKAQKLIGGTIGEKIVQSNRDFQKLIIRFCSNCDEITRIYNSGVSSRQPCQQCGSSMVYKCSRCNKQYDLYTSAHTHTRFCFGEEKPRKHADSKFGSTVHFDCTHCKKEFVRTKWLDKHLLKCKPRTKRRRHNRETFKHLMAICKKCVKSQCVRGRRRVCEDCKTRLHFKCNICDKDCSPERDSWCEHLRAHLDAVKYECDHCGTGLIARHALLAHVKWCASERSFSCDLCTYSTKIKSNLYRHVLIAHSALKT